MARVAPLWPSPISLCLYADQRDRVSEVWLGFLVVLIVLPEVLPLKGFTNGRNLAQPLLLILAEHRF